MVPKQEDMEKLELERKTKVHFHFNSWHYLRMQIKNPFPPDIDRQI